MPPPTSASHLRLPNLALFIFSFGTLTVEGAKGNKGKARTYEIVGHTGVSAQQLWLGNEQKIYVVDKVQKNELLVTNSKGEQHPAWAAENEPESNELRALDVVTNSFCAGGTQLGNGTWLNVGCNNAVTTCGVSLSELNVTEGFGAYKDMSGGRAARFFTPCLNETCEFYDDISAMPENRWYPHLETMTDGSAMILDGELWGGFVNSVDQRQSVPTFEFLPKRGSMKPKNVTFLVDTQSVLGSPHLLGTSELVVLIPLSPRRLLGQQTVRKDGLHQQFYMQADWQTQMFHPETYKEIRLPHAQRTYPSGGGNALLPLTPENSYTPELLFCGGMNPKRDDWNQTAWVVIGTAGSNSCVSIKPLDDKPTWKDEEDLHRREKNMILLPDETAIVLNGAAYGSEDYGWENWHDGKYGQSYGRDPVYRPCVYNASVPSGKKWDTDYEPSTVARMCHSTATLLPDGSVFVAGSSPSADVITEENNATYPYKTEYRAERFYPKYFELPRPVISEIPASISYRGKPFDLTLPAGNVTNPDAVKVSLMRTGFSTHAAALFPYNAGMRQVVLSSTYTQNDDSSVTLHVSQVPPNPAIIAPGMAMLYVYILRSLRLFSSANLLRLGTPGFDPL
ncbi:hypothetical protein JCM11641_003257 [Rhodosporidiobolus odoratus]